MKDAPRLGELRHQIIIEQEGVKTPDGMGGYSMPWDTVATVWARIRPLSGEELLRHRQLQSPVTHEVAIRYLAGVTSAMRLTHNSRVFNIRSVRDLEERTRWTILGCEEGIGS